MSIKLTKDQEDILLMLHECSSINEDKEYVYGVRGPDLAKAVTDGSYESDPVIQFILALSDYKDTGQEVYGDRLGILTLNKIRQEANPFGFWLSVFTGSLGLNINRIDKGCFRIYCL